MMKVWVLESFFEKGKGDCDVRIFDSRESAEAFMKMQHDEGICPYADFDLWESQVMPKRWFEKVGN